MTCRAMSSTEASSSAVAATLALADALFAYARDKNAEGAFKAAALLLDESLDVLQLLFNHVQQQEQQQQSGSTNAQIAVPWTAVYKLAGDINALHAQLPVSDPNVKSASRDGAPSVEEVAAMRVHSATTRLRFLQAADDAYARAIQHRPKCSSLW